MQFTQILEAIPYLLHPALMVLFKSPLLRLGRRKLR